MSAVDDREAPVAIVTGASRGLGLALARSLAERGWRLVVDARGADDARGRRARAACAGVIALAGDVADDRHRRGAGRGRRRAGSTCSSTTPARSARARCRRWPTTRSTSSSASTRSNVVAPLALVAARPAAARAGAPRSSTSPPTPRVEAYEGWGGYGSSKAALEQLTAVLAAEHPRPARLRGRPRRHAHRDAPGGLPRRGHLRPAAARARASRACSTLIEAAPAERPLPRRRARTVHRHERARARPPTLEAHEPPEARGAAATTSRCWSPTGPTAARSTRASATCPRSSQPGDLLVVNTSATLPAALPARGSASEPVRLHLSTPARRRRAGWSSCAPTTGRRFARRRSPEPLARRCRRGARRVLAPFAGSERLAVARLDLDDPLVAYLAGTAGRSATRYVPRRMAARRLPDRLRPRAGQRRDAERRPAVHADARHRARRARRPDRPAHAAHRRLLAGGDEPPYPERYGVPRAPRRGSSTPCTRWGGRVIAVGTTVVRALETAAGRRRTVGGRAGAGPTSWSRRSAASAPSTACSPAGTSRAPRTC